MLINIDFVILGEFLKIKLVAHPWIRTGNYSFWQGRCTKQWRKSLFASCCLSRFYLLLQSRRTILFVTAACVWGPIPDFMIAPECESTRKEVCGKTRPTKTAKWLVLELPGLRLSPRHGRCGLYRAPQWASFWRSSLSTYYRLVTSNLSKRIHLTGYLLFQGVVWTLSQIWTWFRTSK